MPRRRKSGSALAAKQPSEVGAREQSIGARELSTQQSTTLCEDEEAVAFEVSTVQLEAQSSRQQTSEEEARGVDEEADEPQSGPQDPQGSKQESPKGLDPQSEHAYKEDGLKHAEDDCADGNAEGSTEVKEGAQVDLTEREKETKKGDLSEAMDEREQLQKDDAEDGAQLIRGREATQQQPMNDEAEGETTETEAQQGVKLQQKPVGKRQGEDAEVEEQEGELEEPVPKAYKEGEEEGDEKEQEHEEVEGDEEGLVAEERQGSVSLKPSGASADWEGSEVELNVGHSAESLGLCCARDVAGSICEEVLEHRRRQLISVSIYMTEQWAAQAQNMILLKKEQIKLIKIM